MKQFTDAYRPGDRPRRGGPPPPGPPSVWRKRARKALDNWAPNIEFSVAIELQAAYADGIKRAAAFAEEHGQRELAMALRRLADEKSPLS